VRFVADGMLGKLARWLRLLGHDVEYYNSLADSELEHIAEESRRILLTRDLELYQHASSRGIQVFYLEGQSEPARLAELAKRFGISLTIDLNNSRCPKCNARIKEVPKETVRGKVKPNTLEHYDAFWVCRRCGQVYWQGAHWKKIRSVLEAAKEKVKGAA
jgi:uncharacterized protein with PIN domain